MIHQPILVNGDWREASYPVSSFKAVNPLTGRQLPDSFPVSSFLDLDEMLQADELERSAIEAVPCGKRAEFLNLIADEIEKNTEELCQTAHAETGLAIKSYLGDVDLADMIHQLRAAAGFCLDRTWQEATIDSHSNVRSIRGPLSGPIVIFGPANMPFSRNSCGGTDFACAIAAGNSVIAKSNPNHPLTCLKLARIIHSAVQKLELPRSLIQFFFNTTADLGFRLAAHPMIGALAFTGTRKAGMALKESADHAGNLAFINMSGLNPVLLLPGSIAERKGQIAREIVTAVLSNDGQSCRKPGVFFLVENKESSTLIRSIVDEFNANQCKPLLTDLVARNLDSLVAGFIRLGARKLTRKEFYQPSPFVYPDTILHIDVKTWLKQSSQFQEEAFGPVTIFVTLENESQFEAAVKTIENSSSISIYSHTSGDDDLIYNRLASLVRRKAARLLNDRMPTASAAGMAMVSGGAWPASNHPGFTFAGLPAAIKRFTALHCFDGVKHDRLPPDLRSQSTGGQMFRLIDGELIKQ